MEKYKKLQKVMNEYKDTVDMKLEEFLENVAKMNFEDYIRCIKSSLNAPKVFLKRKPNETKINLFNGKILVAWKANLDIQIVLEPYGHVVGYISTSQRGMNALLDAAAKDLKKQVRYVSNVFSNCVEVNAQEAVYLALQILLTKCTRDIVFMSFIPKKISCQRRLRKKMMMIITMKVVLVMKTKTVLKMRMMLRRAIVQACYTKQRMEQDIRKEKCLE